MRTVLNGLDELSVALVEPEYPANIGYVARAMANFGIRNLFIIGKRMLGKGEFEEARKFSSHGQMIIDDLKHLRTVDELRKRFQLLIGTTAISATRKSNLVRRTSDAFNCAEIVSRYRFSGRMKDKACLVFGRDTTGLTNGELHLCDLNLTIRTGTQYNTLHISHAAAIAFFLFSQSIAKARLKHDQLLVSASAETQATRAEREKVVHLFERLGLLSDFQEFKRSRLSETLNHLLAKANPTLRELYLLMGLASKATTKIGALSSNVDGKH
jgi:tRNA/rRNA methyltransferase